jgi:Spy/CpxP family protein refolding chaperone
MSNQQVRLGLVAFVLVAILVFAAALPAVSALTPSTIYGRYQQKTDRFPGGQHICGDKLCSPDQWAKMKNDLRKAQSDSMRCPQLRAWVSCNEQIAAPNTSK